MFPDGILGFIAVIAFSLLQKGVVGLRWVAAIGASCCIIARSGFCFPFAHFLMGRCGCFRFLSARGATGMIRTCDSHADQRDPLIPTAALNGWARAAAHRRGPSAACVDPLGADYRPNDTICGAGCMA
jgi:hypothetical protein